MNSAERIAAAVALQEPDRVPVSPFMIYHFASVTGTSMHDFVWDVDACHRACLKAFQFYDELLDTINLAPMRFGFTCTVPILFSALYYDWRFPEDIKATGTDSIYGNSERRRRLAGFEFRRMVSVPRAKQGNQSWDTLAIPQMFESVQDGPEIYEAVAKRGFAPLRTYKRVGRGEVIKTMSLHLFKHLRWMKRWRRNCDVVPWQEAICYLPAELLLFRRGVEGFIDLLERPEKIIEVNEAQNATIIRNTLRLARLLDARNICFPSLKFSSSMVSPKLFEKLAWPWMKQQALAYAAAGYLVILHLDGDWGPLLEYFTELPKGSAVVELDVTDMVQAKRVLGGKLCIKGNVDPTLLAFGSPEEVERECKRLIDACAPGGGFILSSGCEAPPNSRPENIRAMLRSVL